MSARLAAQLSSISAPEKLPDRLLVSGFLGGSEQRALSEKPILGYLLEVTRPWLPTSIVFPRVIQTLQEQLSDLKLSLPLDDQFEALLKSVNLTLNEVSEQGETDWIGNLNGLLFVIGKQEIHFSQTGHCPTYLLQNNRIRHITDDQRDPDPHPLKTFANLASGVLTPNDTLLIANQELYKAISLDALRRILNGSTPYQGALTIAKELKKEKNPHIAALIIQAVEEKSWQAEPELIPMEEMLESGLKKLYKASLPFLHKTRHKTEQFGAASYALAQKAGAASAVLAKKARDAAKETILAKPTADQPDNPAEPENESEEESKSVSIQEMVDQTSANPETDQPTEEPETPTEFPIGSRISLIHRPKSLQEFGQVLKKGTIPFLTKKLPILIKRGLKRFNSWLQVQKHRRIAALVCGLILILAVVGGAILGQRIPAPTENSTAGNITILSQASTAQPKIAKAIEQEQFIEASNLIKENYRQLASLTTPTEAQQQEAEQLWLQTNGYADQITNTTRLVESANSKFPGNATQFMSSLPYFFGFESNSNNLLRTGTGSLPDINQSIPLPDTSEAVVALSPTSEADTAGYILTKQAKIYRIAQAGSTTLIRPIIPEEGEFATGDALATYAGNLYILDGKSGLLWRYRAGTTSYTKGMMIIDINRTNIKGGISMAIDGSIFVLKENGSILKLTSNEIDTNFALRNLPELSKELIRPLQIIANPSYSSIYILDGGSVSGDHSTAKVIELEKNGNFVQQFAFPDQLTDVKGFDINPKQKKLWILNGQTLHEFAI